MAVKSQLIFLRGLGPNSTVNNQIIAEGNYSRGGCYLKGAIIYNS